MSPAPIGKHQWLSGEFYREFWEQLKNCKRCNVSLPMDWKINEHTVLQPDLFIACFNFKTEKYITQAPSLVMEVLSPSNRNKDTSVKKEIYLQQGVKYYLIIDPEDDSYIVHELADKEYKISQTGHAGSFRFEFEDCHAEIDFGRIFTASS